MTVRQRLSRRVGDNAPYLNQGALGLVCCLVILPLLLASCTKRETPVERGNREQVLHRSVGAEVSDLDPQLATNIAELEVVSALFEGLVAEDPKDLHPIPGLADHWDLSPDQLTYTFVLRPNLKWSNGEALTAADFVESWHRVLTGTLGASNATLLYVVRGAEAFHKGVTKDFSTVGATAPDGRTVRVTLEHPTAYFLSLLTHPVWYPVPTKTIAANGGRYDRGNGWTKPGKLVTSGPFTLKTWSPNRVIEVEKSATYWDAARVRLHAVDFYPIDSVDAEERAFRAGQLHATYVLPFAKTDAYRKNSPQFLRIDPYLNTYFVRFNTVVAPLNKDRVRRALSMAIDRKSIAEKILRGDQQPAHALTPPGLPGYTPPAGIPTDFSAARTLLTEAGYPGGKGLPTLELLFNNSENHRILAEALQEMWRRELGVDVQLRNQEFKVVLNERRAGHFQLLLGDWVGDYLDPTTFLDLWRSDSGNNYTGWSSTDYDALLFAAARNPDPGARARQLQQAEALMLNAAPIAPIYYNTHVFLLQPSVKGWEATLLDHHPFKYVWLAP